LHIISEQSARDQTSPAIDRWGPTVSYLSQTEVHVYALSIGASALLSFYPFLIVMFTLIRDFLHFRGAEQALIVALGDYFPGDLVAALTTNLNKVKHGRFQIASLLLLMFTANGVFEPLEVALNRAWHVPNNRSYIKNQILSFFLILLCGGLALASVLLTAMNTKFVAAQYGIRVFPVWLSLAIFKIGAVPMTILSLFVVYWVLPNRRIPPRRVLPVAVLVGVALEALKYLFLFAWPWLGRKFQNEYGPFYYAVSVVVFGLLSAFIVLAGAEWSARPLNEFDEPAQS
jgi:YihY family inner membrane protein